MASQGAPVSFLCELGWHAPEQPARWNDGYYFTRCRRCRRDLVRTAYGRWHVPRGLRVVWQAKPPRSYHSARLVQDKVDAFAPRVTRRSNAPSETELPIQAVLRHLHAQEEKRTAEPAAPAHEPQGERRQGLDQFSPQPAPPESPTRPVADVSGEASTGDTVAEPDVALHSRSGNALEQAGNSAEAEPLAAADAGSDPTPPAELDARPDPDAAADFDAAVTVENNVAAPDAMAEPDTGVRSEVDEGAASTTEAEPVAEPEPEPEQPAQRRSQIPDFMADWSPTTDWVYVPTPRRKPPEPEPEPEPGPELDSEPHAEPGPQPEAQLAFEAFPEAAAPTGKATEAPSAPSAEEAVPAASPHASAEGFTAGGEEGESQRPLEPALTNPAGADVQPRLGHSVHADCDEQPSPSPTAVLLAISLPLLILIVAMQIGRSPTVVEVYAPPPPAPSQRPSPTATQQAFVTASVLNCRSAPARQAPPVRRLGRGATVAVLARDADWASIAYRGQQCWALSRYLSGHRPA
jgi:hypothetical protein